MRCGQRAMRCLLGLCVAAAMGAFPLAGAADPLLPDGALPGDTAGASAVSSGDGGVGGASALPAGGESPTAPGQGETAGGDEGPSVGDGEGALPDGAPAPDSGSNDGAPGEEQGDSQGTGGDEPLQPGPAEPLPPDPAEPVEPVVPPAGAGDGDAGDAGADQPGGGADEGQDAPPVADVPPAENAPSVGEVPSVQEDAPASEGDAADEPAASAVWDLSVAMSADRVGLGSPLTVEARVSGSDAAGFTYNYVWNHEGAWQYWGSASLKLGGLTEDTSWTFTFERPGRYQIFVDAVAPDGTAHTVERWVEVPDWSAAWSLSAQDMVLGEKLALSARVSGAETRGFTYNFVWNYEGKWEHWGSAAKDSGGPVASASWEFELPYRGRYQIIMDVIDPSGSSKSYEAWVDVAGDWALSQITATGGKVGEPMTITAVTKGNTDQLRYKFVWEKDNWEQWGVIQNASASNTATWTPQVSGDVNIYVDVFDSPLDDAATHTKRVAIASEQWGYDALALSDDLIRLGESITITPQVSGETTWLSYKYVWEKDNWAQWGVISGPTAGNASQGWKPTEPGEYTVYCDVTGSNGVTRTKTATFAVWNVEGMDVEWQGGDTWRISADLGIRNPERYGFTFNYVWNYEGAWNRWGSTVLETGGRTTDTVWYFTPDREGSYDIHIDVVAPDGKVGAADSSVVRYDGAQYDMWRRVQNYTSPTQWLLACDTSSCVTGVYRRVDGHWEQVYRWLCSPGAPGTPTVTGVFSVGIKGYYFDSFGSRQYYYTQFWGDYLFHSTTYYTNGAVMDDRLGMHLSHGCIRLATGNAKWIYDNIPYGTTVVVY